jgi:hypothetical protein
MKKQQRLSDQIRTFVEENSYKIENSITQGLASR